MFNVKYVVAPSHWDSHTFARLIQTFGRHNLYTVETAGYFELVKSDLSLAGATSDFSYVASGWLASTLPEAKRHPRVYVDDFDGLPGLTSFSESTNVIQYDPLPVPSSIGSVLSEKNGEG